MSSISVYAKYKIAVKRERNLNFNGRRTIYNNIF